MKRVMELIRKILRKIDEHPLGTGLLLVAPMLAFSSLEANAWEVECKPSTAIICGPLGCSKSAASDMTVNITEDRLIICNEGKCGAIDVLSLESSGHWIWVSGKSFYVSVSKDTSSYVRSLNIGLGALVEHGTCSLR
jgi:hypothetical protein